jgi:hypothetical protein
MKGFVAVVSVFVMLSYRNIDIGHDWIGCLKRLSCSTYTFSSHKEKQDISGR